MSLERYGYRCVSHAVDIDFTVLQLLEEHGPFRPAYIRVLLELARLWGLAPAIARLNQPLRKLRPGELRYPG